MTHGALVCTCELCKVRNEAVTTAQPELDRASQALRAERDRLLAQIGDLETAIRILNDLRNLRVQL